MRGDSGSMATTHTVTRGDTLSALALHYYGRASHGNIAKIYEANLDVLRDEDTVPVEQPPFEHGKGQPVVLTIPD
jgi:nucleoid-associated protein YgaU